MIIATKSVAVDGIKAITNDSGDDQGATTAPVMVDLLHPVESAAAGAGPARPIAQSPVRPPVPSPRVAPITPLASAPAEPSVEMVPPPPVVQPTMASPIAPPPPPPPPPSSSLPSDAAARTTATFGAPRRRRGRLIGLIALVGLVLVIGGVAVAAYISRQSAKPITQSAPAGSALTAAAPTNLSQQVNGKPLAVGAVTATPPTFTFTMPASGTSGSATAQIELQPLGTAFTGSPTAAGPVVAASGNDLSLSISVPQLADGAYHWQVRTQVGSQTSAWVAFNSAGSATPDFTLKTTGPTAPTVGAVTGGSVSGTTINLTQNQPTLSGHADPGSTLSLTISPDNITLAPTVAADGSWSVSPSQPLPNGSHTLVVTATSSTGKSAQTTYQLNVNPAAGATGSGGGSSPKTVSSSGGTGRLAPTGDATGPLSLAALAMILGGGLALIWVRLDERR